MTSAIAILTYRRAGPLRALLDSIEAHAPGYPVAVFEDCANWDRTVLDLTDGAVPRGYDQELDSDVWQRGAVTIFVGRQHVGVSGGSNKAMRWFERNGWDHLCLCNDDLVAKGDFVAAYAHAHARLKTVELLCFSDFTQEDYLGVPIMAKGLQLKLLPRMVGIMMSMTRRLVDTVGYFDATFGPFGNDHCDLNNRAYLAGLVVVNDQAVRCLDIETDTLAHQEVVSSVQPFELPALQARAERDIALAAQRYDFEGLYRPFRLPYASAAGGPDGTGISCRALDRLGYTFVQGRV